MALWPFRLLRAQKPWEGPEPARRSRMDLRFARGSGPGIFRAGDPGRSQGAGAAPGPREGSVTHSHARPQAGMRGQWAGQGCTPRRDLSTWSTPFGVDPSFPAVCKLLAWGGRCGLLGLAGRGGFMFLSSHGSSPEPGAQRGEAVGAGARGPTASRRPKLLHESR